MKNKKNPYRVFAISIILTCMLALLNGCQNTPSKPQLHVENIWSRPVEVRQADKTATGSAENRKRMDYTGIVYFDVRNAGGEADRLIRAKTDVCRAVEIHETKVENGRMSMRMLENGMPIPAGETVKFSPGGHHIMLIGVNKSLKIGEKFSVALEFEKSGTVTVHSEIREY